VTDRAEDYRQRVRDDPGLRVMLKAARAWGVPPGRFMGHEPARAYVLERDDLGRVARIVEHADPEWDDASRHYAVALQLWEADLCDGCGLPMSETTKPENEGRYVGMAAVRCHACTAHVQASGAYQDSPHPSALRIPLEHIPVSVNGDGSAADVRELADV
jgi:hypothetical protein